MEHSRYLSAIRDESERFGAALRVATASDPVPTCPGWAVADLHWHLAEVQHFWSQVVGAGLVGGDVAEPDRPLDAHLAEFAARSGTALLAALAEHEPDDACWSWSPDGHSVGWVARRQAHEALIHRVDAEVAAGLPVTPPAVDLAADGVDEMLTVMLDGVPGEGDLTLDGTTVRLACTDTDDAWVLALGRFAGTRSSGDPYEIDVAALLAEDDGGDDDAVVSGSAWDLDRWLWGRGSLGALTVEGDAGLLARLRAMVVEATQ
ncbi:maleylpyruvate isomerase family mycothiol-dependent enzyme [Actinotalea sp.]|uniref:maleylpyruvate isomerase family mycothiol-dependent enzyme n=1 Tax=Actinotalea sp. TaxID=1872145 RepID=UPI002B59A7F9|nr:maleylpyruvate isomerase family mycothiol-dependent enzyme [Actinotalea sp.]HQY34129.1 maleylpyruvate isomerase family mycothiol-dependent enzyme [Actinotalea sp.]HRA49486.1 maleylpyruvate isomerase family mycothiol-dependent enzyme [Actinotalea sp.]